MQPPRPTWGGFDHPLAQTLISFSFSFEKIKNK
jgi:hypothetical protein